MVDDQFTVVVLLLRKTLYMAVLTARRTNPVIKAFADRLQQQGEIL
ncbi:MAG: hypothetical protein R3C11_11120 [Planctomycetaceae bacterium]